MLYPSHQHVKFEYIVFMMSGPQVYNRGTFACYGQCPCATSIFSSGEPEKHCRGTKVPVFPRLSLSRTKALEKSRVHGAGGRQLVCNSAQPGPRPTLAREHRLKIRYMQRLFNPASLLATKDLRRKWLGVNLSNPPGGTSQTHGASTVSKTRKCEVVWAFGLCRCN